MRFGDAVVVPEIDRLRSDMNDTLRSLFDAELPIELRREARETLFVYAGHNVDFFALFYRPTWSFLQWSATPPRSHNVMQAHAMSLFLHLWDDHLVDGQLAASPVRLAMRDAAWMCLEANLRVLCRSKGVPAADIARATTTYRRSQRSQPRPARLDGHLAHFRRTIALWTIAPDLLGGSALVEVIERFGVAWRIVDDMQDLREDLLAGSQSAVRLALPPQERALWDRCVAASAGRDSLDTASVDALDGELRRNDCIRKLVRRAEREVHQAADIATAHGWNDLAAELVAHVPLQVVTSDLAPSVSIASTLE